jgi:ubiquitin-conjugating enzyme E2 S
VSSAGEICVNTLKKDWQSSFGIGHILVTVKCLLIYPNPESALDEEAGKALLEDYEGYCKRAKMMTSVHATPRVKPIEFQTSSPPASTVVSSSQSIPSPGDIASSTPQKMSASQPLQESSPSNQATMTVPASTISSKSISSKEKENPLPLGLADSNINIAARNGAAESGPAKAIKRSAVANGEAKRKKALKRL